MRLNSLAVTIINVGLVTVAVVFRNKTSSGLLAVALVQATSLVFTLTFVVLAAAEVSISRIGGQLARVSLTGLNTTVRNLSGSRVTYTRDRRITT